MSPANGDSQRLFEAAFALACDAKENGCEFPLVIVFTDANHTLAAVSTINDFGKLHPEVSHSNPGWAWEPGVHLEPFRAALTGAVPLLSLQEEGQLMNRTPN
jgi:hypothetical protein